MSVPERYKGPWEKTYWAFVGGRRGSLVFFVFTTRQKERSQKHSDVVEGLAPHSIKVMGKNYADHYIIARVENKGVGNIF